MTAQGIHLNLRLGPVKPIPAPRALLSRLQRAEIRVGGRGGSGFALTFAVGHAGQSTRPMFPFKDNPILAPCNRVIISVVVRGVPTVILDGEIRGAIEFIPGRGAGDTVALIRGREFAAVALGKQSRNDSHENLSDSAIVTKLLARSDYRTCGFTPRVEQPPSSQPSLASQMVPTQQSTDLAYIQMLAKRNGYLFYVEPGPLPETNTAYWGPRNASGSPQEALSVNMGSYTNVDSFSVVGSDHAGLIVETRIKDRVTNKVVTITSSPTSQHTPLAATPLAVKHPGLVKKETLREPGMTTAQAIARTQAMSDMAADGAIRATGSLSPARYGAVLAPHKLVNVRGVGDHNGKWYVESVTHEIAVGSYTQSFTLQREGHGSKSGRV